MYLVDTSAWVAHFSRRDPFDLRTVCEPDDRVLCLPVYQELLQGIREEGHYRRMAEILGAARFVESPLGIDVFREAANLYRTARRQGFTVRSSVDCLVAQCAIRSNLTLLHRDRDYPLLARVSLLSERGV